MGLPAVHTTPRTPIAAHAPTATTPTPPDPACTSTRRQGAPADWPPGLAACAAGSSPRSVGIR
eukprot:1195307-Prorocentrum_minimum.AAC.3